MCFLCFTRSQFRRSPLAASSRPPSPRPSPTASSRPASRTQKNPGSFSPGFFSRDPQVVRNVSATFLGKAGAVGGGGVRAEFRSEWNSPVDCSTERGLSEHGAPPPPTAPNEQRSYSSRSQDIRMMVWSRSGPTEMMLMGTPHTSSKYSMYLRVFSGSSS